MANVLHEICGEAISGAPGSRRARRTELETALVAIRLVVVADRLGLRVTLRSVAVEEAAREVSKTQRKSENVLVDRANVRKSLHSKLANEATTELIPILVLLLRSVPDVPL